MNHFHLQSLWRTQSLWNAVGDESSVTSIQPRNLRRNIMKKLTHIAAPVALTALLSACAVPGPEQMMQEASLYLDLQQALENPGPGGLQPATVQQALDENPAPGTNLYLDVQQALENPGPGGLQQAVQQALDENPAPGNLSEAVQHLTQGASQEAVNAAVQQALAQQLASQMTGKEKEDILYQQLDFVFENMEGRDSFKKALATIFDDPRYKRRDRKIGGPPSPNDKGGFTYKLTDPWGIPEGQKEEIELRIRKAATSAGIEMPVSWLDDPKHRRLLNDTLTYRSVDADSKVVAKSVDITCTNTIRFKVDTATLQAKGTTDVWVYDTQEGGPIAQVGDDYVTAALPGTLVEGKCHVVEDAKWYVMAFTIDTTPRVAEYHEVYATWEGKPPVELASKEIPGEFIKGRPACPPETWKKDADAYDPYDQFKKELGEVCGRE